MISAQQIKIHSHNDYRQSIPFFNAYKQQCASIEVDIFTSHKGDKLLVAHDIPELPDAPTIEDAYLNPLVNIFNKNNGRAWENSDQLLFLLIDLKTPANPTLDILIKKLEKYPEVFEPAINPYAVRVIISGNRPDPESFSSYPTFISFDGSKTNYTPEQLERISMISLNLRDYTSWNGMEPMKMEDKLKIKEVIEAVHKLGKPIRFWNTPDGKIAWHTFYTMGVDFINTDQPEECTAFFCDFLKRNK